MNKKLLKVLAGLAMAGTLTAGAVAFSACNNDVTSEGEYHYANAWSPEAPHYGIKVNVTVQGKGAEAKIAGVEVLESDYVSVTESWENKATWNNGLENLLGKYRGQSVVDVLLTDVATNEGGQPESVGDSNLMISGATQGSGRLLLAVQDALKKADLGLKVVEGEYHYANPWSADAPHYGIKVRVVVADGKILGVNKLTSGYVSVTESWENKNTWINGLQAHLAKYKGKTVDEVKAVNVQKAENGEPLTVEKGQDIGEYNLTGATQGSGRLLLAVQDALSKL